MRAKSILTQCLVSLLFILTSVCPAANGRIIYVDDDGPADFNTIQAAIDDANDGDTVLVAPGTYTGDGNRDIDFKGKAITVKSEDGPETCIIDCQGSPEELHRGFYFHSSEDANSVVQGFYITNGYTKEYESGGAILCENSSPHIINCIITNNQAQAGGAICAAQTYRQPGPLVIGCMISNNQASYGGAIFCSRSDAMLVNTILYSNIASDLGGAIFCNQSAPSFTSCTIVKNHADNSGGAFNGDGAATWTNNRDVIFENCIIWDNSAPEGSAIARMLPKITGSPSVKITHCCLPLDMNSLAPWGFNAWFIDISNSVFSLNPRFMDPQSGDFRLRFDSPCIDAGTNTPIQTLPFTDINGIPRIVDGDCNGEAIIDLGANETQVPDNAVFRPSMWNIEFVAYEDNPIPEPKQVTIKKLGTGAISWEAISDCDWLSVLPKNGLLTEGVSDVMLVLCRT